MKVPLVLAGSCVLIAGCAGGDPNACGGSQGAAVLILSPTTATLSSSAASPANQVQFVANFSYPNSTVHGDCVVSNVVVRPIPVWTNPDPIDITIDSSTDLTNGTAVCKAPTKGAVTLTATTGTGSSQLTATVQMTCQ